MCLIAFCHEAKRDPSLVLIANRDEFHARPARPACWWNQEGILAGRDLKAGGTWLAVGRTGRLAAITNYREVPASEARRSRGELPVRFLTSATSSMTFAEEVFADGADYGGFNLLLFDGRDCVVVSNRSDRLVEVTPGAHAISNGGFDTDWPKVRRSRRRLDSLTSADEPPGEAQLMAILKDEIPAPDEALPQTGVGLQMERFLSPPFIRGPDYGTRASTVVTIGRQDIEFIEHRYGPVGVPLGRSAFRFARRER